MGIKKRYNRENKKRRYKSKYKIDKNRYRKQHIIMLNAANYYGTIFTMKISR